MAAASEASARVPVNPAVLREARETANLSRQRALGLVNQLLKREDRVVTDSEFRSWEEGVDQPDVIEAEVLAKAYLVPFVALLQTELSRRNISDFRLGPGGESVPPSYDTLEKLHRFSKFYLVAKRVAAGLGLAEDIAIPDVDVSDVRDAPSIEAVASRLRASLGVSENVQLSWEGDEAALNGWRESLEAAGVFVFALPMAVSECRGASLWEPGGPPAILLNTADSAPARMFTLMHEAGHLMFAKRGGSINLCDPSGPPRQREEQLANRVAGAALLPRSLVLPQVPEPVPAQDYSLWPRRERDRLRRSLKASNAVIGIRLQQLGVVADAGVRAFWRRPSSFVPHPPSRPVWQRYRHYLGARTTGLAARAIETKAVSAAELCRILDIKVKDVEAMLV